MGLSQTSLADAAKVPQAQVSRVETGARRATDAYLAAVAEPLDIPDPARVTQLHDALDTSAPLVLVPGTGRRFRFEDPDQVKAYLRGETDTVPTIFVVHRDGPESLKAALARQSAPDWQQVFHSLTGDTQRILSEFDELAAAMEKPSPLDEIHDHIAGFTDDELLRVLRFVRRIHDKALIVEPRRPRRGQQKVRAPSVDLPPTSSTPSRAKARAVSDDQTLTEPGGQPQ